MVNIAVAGAGLTGVGAALVLARRGQHMVLVESDAAPVPAAAEEKTVRRPLPAKNRAEGRQER